MKTKKANQTASNALKVKTTLRYKLKKVLSFIFGLGVALLFFGGIMMWSRWYEREEVNEIKKSNTSIVGTIVKVGSMKGSYAVAEYFVDGKRYEINDNSPADDIYKGEHYLIIYKATAPNVSRIDFTSPVFLDGEQTRTTTATIVYKDRITAGFTYTVDGQNIKRFQEYPDGEQLYEGQTFPVEYLVKNPRVGILKIK